MHSWLDITIALTIPESASWRAVGNPGNYGQGPGKHTNRTSEVNGTNLSGKPTNQAVARTSRTAAPFP